MKVQTGPRIVYGPYERLLRDVRRSEARMYCHASLAFVIDAKIVYQLVNEVWHGKSAISEKRLPRPVEVGEVSEERRLVTVELPSLNSNGSHRAQEAGRSREVLRSDDAAEVSHEESAGQSAVRVVAEIAGTRGK